MGGPATRIAMWSGPRNISTAMMRSWGNRDDTFVCDEPLYAHYLAATELDHPGRAEVLDSHDTDWRRVVDWLTGPIPEGRTLFYQKHMAHHLLPEIDRGWLDTLSHAFLIRDPREMLTSLVEHLPRPTLADTGLPQQLEVFERVRRRTGTVPPVVDARDVLEAPEAMLRSLCAALGVSFSSRMLSWPSGPRATDGVWAKHWYAAVLDSTGFRAYRPKSRPVPESLGDLLEACREPYASLSEHRFLARG